MPLPNCIFAGTVPEDFTSVTNVPTTSTVSSTYETDFSKISIGLNNGEEVLQTLPLSSEVTLHTVMRPNSENIGTNNENIRLYSNTGSDVVFNMKGSNGGPGLIDYQFFYYPNGVETEFGTLWTTDTATVKRFDVHIVMDASVGSVRVAVDEVTRAEVTGVRTTPATGTQVDSFTLRGSGVGNTNNYYYSETCVFDSYADAPRLYTAVPNAAGNYTDFTGTFADIDELDISVLDFIDATVANNQSTFGTDASLGTLDAQYDDLQVTALITNVYARDEGSGVPNFQHLTRSSTTDDLSGTIVLSTGYVMHQQILLNDPATTAAWSRAGVDAVEVGVKAIA